LQRVPEPKQGKNQMHLDLRVEDLPAEVERLARLGARQLSGELTERCFRWVILADPEGNEFCVFVPPAASGTAQ
jgi:predicted enzyme related to lactoylglutathione lyase